MKQCQSGLKLPRAAPAGICLRHAAHPDLRRRLPHPHLAARLSEAGYAVSGARPGEPNRDQTADLVIAAVYMPKNTGVQSLRDIQAAHPDTPLIAISGQFRSGLSAGGATAQSLGVEQVIAKPLVHRDLLEAVRGIIGVRK